MLLKPQAKINKKGVKIPTYYLTLWNELKIYF